MQVKTAKATAVNQKVAQMSFVEVYLQNQFEAQGMSSLMRNLRNKLTIILLKMLCQHHIDTAVVS
ncbi:MAG: hypothetical protein ACYTXY_09020 [Nostoc sp.]